jgi:hypothetical protein
VAKVGDGHVADLGRSTPANVARIDELVLLLPGRTMFWVTASGCLG